MLTRSTDARRGSLRIGCAPAIRLWRRLSESTIGAADRSRPPVVRFGLRSYAVAGWIRDEAGEPVYAIVGKEATRAAALRAEASGGRQGLTALGRDGAFLAVAGAIRPV